MAATALSAPIARTAAKVFPAIRAIAFSVMNHYLCPVRRAARYQARPRKPFRAAAPIPLAAAKLTLFPEPRRKAFPVLTRPACPDMRRRRCPDGRPPVFPAGALKKCRSRTEFDTDKNLWKKFVKFMVRR